ncbi:hypothetical protein [Mycobacterium sp.]|uniref:hypothetical protein n=1 Tax=Mycobacterium sp. TaxID=1785 RepID=UPI0025CD29D5|nr:hypothetical protein [Mycobacterium sp.]
MAASEQFRVNPEAPASSAAHAIGQGEDLGNTQLSSDTQMVAAQSGWVGASALAINAKTATWLKDSHRLVARVGDHASDLGSDGRSFAEMERDHVKKLQTLHPGPQGPAGSV